MIQNHSPSVLNFTDQSIYINPHTSSPNLLVLDLLDFLLPVLGQVSQPFTMDFEFINNLFSSHFSSHTKWTIRCMSWSSTHRGSFLSLLSFRAISAWNYNIATIISGLCVRTELIHTLTEFDIFLLPLLGPKELLCKHRCELKERHWCNCWWPFLGRLCYKPSTATLPTGGMRV